MQDDLVTNRLLQKKFLLLDRLAKFLTMLPTSYLSLALGLFSLAAPAAAHSFDPRGDAIEPYRRSYAHRHRSLNARCGESIRRRRIRRSLNKRDDLSPRVRDQLLESFMNKRDDDSSNSSACLLTPETTQGPYHVLGEKVQQDIRGGQAGVPLWLEIDFVDIDTCEPLTNAWIDVWSANATGIYSGYEAASSGASTGGAPGDSSSDNSTSSMTMPSSASMTSAASESSSTTTIDSYTAGADVEGGGNLAAQTAPADGDSFLRGVWQTDDDGLLTMYSIVPGWYQGRAVHTHLKVYEESSGFRADNGTFIANASAHHTGQWFFDNDTMAAVAALDPYTGNKIRYEDATTNAEDGIYPYADSMGTTATLDITWVNASDITYGIIGSTTVGVNLTYSSTELTTYYWDPDTTASTTTESTSTSSTKSHSSSSSASA